MDLDILIRLTHFLSFQEESIGSIQFNREIINMMLPTKFVWVLNFTLIWPSQQDIVFNLSYIFKSPSNFFCLDLKLAQFFNSHT